MFIIRTLHLESFDWSGFKDNERKKPKIASVYKLIQDNDMSMYILMI